MLIFIGGYALYFLFLKTQAYKKWNLKINRGFMPNVSIMIPLHNEEKIIEQKLENIREISYPKEKIEIIVTDDASTDQTPTKTQTFKEKNKELNIKLIRNNSRLGKAKALNAALPSCKNDIIIVSDADCFWPSDILLKALPYLSDASVGAITGRGLIKNAHKSWLTQEERYYTGAMSLLRLGESKIHSTLRFEGGFCAYKRGVIDEFDSESGADDSGTALNIVQKGYRTILIPQATFFTDFPENLRDKIKVKTRRASQLIWIWIKCLKLLVKRRLSLPKKIAIPEIFLFLLNPVVFVALTVTTVIAFFAYPILLISFALILAALNLIPIVRGYFLELIQSNIILFYSLISYFKGKKYTQWD